MNKRHKHYLVTKTLPSLFCVFYVQDIRVYNGVRILKPVCTSKGVTYQISFDVSKLRRILWENSKRLIYGSLLCLSKDNFETFILATVEDRKPELLKEVTYCAEINLINLIHHAVYKNDDWFIIASVVKLTNVTIHLVGIDRSSIYRYKCRPCQYNLSNGGDNGLF